MSDKTTQPPTLEIHSIDIHVKTWWDKVNGNTYFSGQITVDYGMSAEKTLLMPFQYGYGNQSEWEARMVLQEAGYIPGGRNIPGLAEYCRINGIIYRYSKNERCLQRDVKAFGSGKY